MQAKIDKGEIVLDTAQDVILDALHDFATKRHSTVSAVFHSWDKARLDPLITLAPLGVFCFFEGVSSGL